MPWCHRPLIAWMTLVALCAPSAASAQPNQPVTRSHQYSPYEKESIREALAKTDGQLDPAPEGKTVESIEVVSLEVIEKRDPAPGFLNIFHATTRPYVIRREVLLKPGDPYSQGLCDETARNLRGFHQLSMVACVAERGSRPDRVRVLVVAKDVWSLRLNSDFQFAAGKLEYLALMPSEENLLGTHQTGALLFVLQPLSYSLGARYVVPRVAGTWVRALGEMNVIVNRETGQTEGSYGGVSVGQPLYSTRTRWAWSVPITWINEVTRQYVDAELRHFNSPLTGGNDRIPWEYRTNRVVIAPSVTRSFGWALKNDILAGLELSRRQYTLAFDPSRYDPVATQDFLNRYVPVGDDRAGPFLQWRTYRTDFVRVLDLETLALQEDYRLGHELYVRLFPSVAALSSTRNVLGLYAGAQYTWALGDGIIRFGVESTTEYQPGEADGAREGLTDAAVRATGRIVTPSLGFGRLVADGLVYNRYRNHLNAITYLGGESRLRGYPTRYFYGKDVVAYNFELRSHPVELLSCQIAATAFYDVGDAFDGMSQMRLKSSVGAGLRALFPQLDRAVLRVDVGFPMTPGYIPSGGFPGQVFASFFQAFPMPGISPR